MSYVRVRSTQRGVPKWQHLLHFTWHHGVAVPSGNGANMAGTAMDILKKVSDQYLRYHTEPEEGTQRMSHRNSRGTGWGGSSVVNGLMFVRGKSADFDRWAKDDFCSELWSYQKCLPYFKKLEIYTRNFEQSDAIDETTDAEYFKCLIASQVVQSPMKVTSGRLNNRLYSKCHFRPEFIRAAMQAVYKYNPDGETQEWSRLGGLECLIYHITRDRRNS